MRRAFTLIELIFVIIIIGILATMGTQIFTNLFSAYYTSKMQNDLESKTEIILDQIVNRLAFRIKQSTILSTNANAFTSLESSAGVLNTGNFALEWISFDNDSRSGIANNWNDTFIAPSWSGLIDLQASSANTIVDPALKTPNLRDTILSLSYGVIDISLDNGYNAPVIIYPNAEGDAAGFGWYTNLLPLPAAPLVHPVIAAANSFTPVAAAPDTFRGASNEVYEHYYLAYSAYAIEFNPLTHELWLHYNYQPWNREIYTEATANHTLLAENVTTFKLLQIGTLIKVQLCLGLSAFEQASYGEDYSICKEQAVF